VLGWDSLLKATDHCIIVAEQFNQGREKQADDDERDDELAMNNDAYAHVHKTRSTLHRPECNCTPTATHQTIKILTTVGSLVVGEDVGA
jgi:hypothetical protein